MSDRPTRKARKRERREAARHSLTVEQLRNRKAQPSRRRKLDGYADHETWRREVTS